MVILRFMSDARGTIEHVFDNVRPVVTSSSPSASAVVAARACLAAVRQLPADGSEAELVDLLGTLEDLKAAAAAAQARAADRLDRAVRARHAAAALPSAEHGRGVAAQVALARHESPTRGARHLGLAKALVHEMPHALAALTVGHLSEWRATLLVRETACLTVADRATIDAQLCANPVVLFGLGDRELASRARALAFELDPEAAVGRASRAPADRRVTLRPAPDVMAQLTGLLPVAQGVAAYAALCRAADAARAAGDSRSRGQVMADTLVERLTGQARAADVPVEVQLVMTDRTMLEGDREPALIPGYGPIPAALARDLVRPGNRDAAPAPDAAAAAEVWLRRLFTHPATGELVALEARSRCFPEGLRRLLVVRDRVCRTPWCDAPVRHADHATGSAVGGATSAANGQGLCELCNYAKEAPGWSARPVAAPTPGGHAIATTTPTRHRYVSTPPPQPGHRPRSHAPPRSRVEIAFTRALTEVSAA